MGQDHNNRLEYILQYMPSDMPCIQENAHFLEEIYTVCPTILPITSGRRDGFISFSKTIVQWEPQLEFELKLQIRFSEQLTIISFVFSIQNLPNLKDGILNKIGNRKRVGNIILLEKIYKELIIYV